MTNRPLFEGIACALGAGLAWGLVFVIPQLLADYPPAMLSFGRYLSFGIIALPLALHDRHRLLALTRADWGSAFELALSGNIIYYICISAAIQLIDVPLPTMLIGTLPVVIAIVSNLHEGTLPWRRLAPSLLVISLGIALVNHHELKHLTLARTPLEYAVGVAAGLAAVAAWTWYPIRNARWLKQHPQLASGTWATAQGLASMPLAAVGMLACGLWYAANPGADFDFPLGPRPATYFGLMLVAGLVASWFGTLLWNRASKLLPTVFAGQLIVFETLAALSYAFILRGAVPGGDALAGIVLLVIGVLLGARAFQVRR